MNRLIVTKNGKQVSELFLETGREYIIGRDSSCDIVLEAVRGVSREHFRISGDDGGFHVELLSRFGELYNKDGKKVSEMLLSPGEEFQVPPYHFQWLHNGQELSPLAASEPARDFSQPDFGQSSEPPEEPQGPSFDEEPVSQPITQKPSRSLQPQSRQPEPPPPEENFDDQATAIRTVELMPSLRVTDRLGTDIKTYTLNGHHWTVGRDEICTVKVDNTRFSRKHFQIRKEEGIYQIMDLDSSNGTLLNSAALFPKQWRVLSSGDLIEVADWRLYFELRDQTLDAELNHMPALYQPPAFQQSQQPYGGGIGDEVNFVKPGGGGNKRLLIVRGLIAFLVVVGLGLYMSEGDDSSAPAPAAKNLTAFDKLKPEQRMFVKDTYRMADSLYREGRYEMARQEIAKIHQLIPAFEDSNELERLATVGIQTKIDNDKLANKEKEQAEMQEKIQRTVGQCRELIQPKIEMKAIDECLSPIIALNPDDPAITGLKGQVEQMIAERLMKAEKKAEYQALVRKHKAMFEKAEKVEKTGEALSAVKAYESFLTSTLPDPENLKEKAKRQLASLQDNITKQQAAFEKSADDDFKKGDFKSAVQNLKKALDLNPENETIKGHMASMLGELKKQMQTLYQEGVLEESVGEVETAKGKWRKIIDLSLPDEDYYKKAKIKLKKYGVE